MAIKHNAFKVFLSILIVILLITLIIVIVVKFNLKKTGTSLQEDQYDDTISMIESDDGASHDESTQKTNPNDDGFGTEVGM